MQIGGNLRLGSIANSFSLSRILDFGLGILLGKFTGTLAWKDERTLNDGINSAGFIRSIRSRLGCFS